MDVKLDLIKQGLESIGHDPIGSSIEVRSAAKEDLQWCVAEIDRLRTEVAKNAKMVEYIDNFPDVDGLSDAVALVAVARWMIGLGELGDRIGI